MVRWAHRSSTRNSNCIWLCSIISKLSKSSAWKQRLAPGTARAPSLHSWKSDVPAQPSCSNCQTAVVRPWGESHDLKRNRCTGCAKMFNCLTGTPLARLRKKAQWLRFGTCLSDSATVHEAVQLCYVAKFSTVRPARLWLACAKRRNGCVFDACLSDSAGVREAVQLCNVATTTSFRWRHPFSKGAVAVAEALPGIPTRPSFDASTNALKAGETARTRRQNS